MSETPQGPTVPGVQGESASTLDLTADELFHTLQHERRRYVLRHLLDREGPVDVESLAEQVAEWEHGTVTAEIPAEERRRIYVDLYQSHLPKLDELDLIAFDRSREVVEPTPSIELFEPHLSLQSTQPGDLAGPDSGADRGWLEYYVGAALASIALVTMAVLGPVASVTLSFRTVAGVVTAIHAVLTAGLLVSRER